MKNIVYEQRNYQQRFESSLSDNIFYFFFFFFRSHFTVHSVNQNLKDYIKKVSLCIHFKCQQIYEPLISLGLLTVKSCMLHYKASLISQLVPTSAMYVFIPATIMDNTQINNFANNFFFKFNFLAFFILLLSMPVVTKYPHQVVSNLI